MSDATTTEDTLEAIAQRSGLRPGLIREIRDIAAECGIQELVLFGSRARGSNRKYSDIDLACRGGDFGQFAMDVDEETGTALKFDVVDLDAPMSSAFRARIEEEGVPFL